MLTNSPWAQMAEGGGKSAAGPPVLVFFASSGPMRLAEQESKRRASLRRPAKGGEPAEPDPFSEEYRLGLGEKQGTQGVGAVANPKTAACSRERGGRRL